MILVTNRVCQCHWHLAYNGMKMVLFGNTIAPYSVFILDVKTLVWTKGAGPKLDQERWSATCTVVNDYFIVVGGTRMRTNE